MRIQDTSREIHEIIPGFLYLTRNRGLFIFVKPACERKDVGNTIVFEQDGVARRLEVIKIVPLLKIVKAIKMAIRNRNRSRKAGPCRTAKRLEI